MANVLSSQQWPCHKAKWRKHIMDFILSPLKRLQLPFKLTFLAVYSLTIGVLVYLLTNTTTQLLFLLQTRWQMHSCNILWYASYWIGSLRECPLAVLYLKFFGAKGKSLILHFCHCIYTFFMCIHVILSSSSLQTTGSAVLVKASYCIHGKML